MSLPRDREEDFRVTIFNLIQDQVRVVLEGYRALLDMLEQFLKGEKVKKIEEHYRSCKECWKYYEEERRESFKYF